MLVRIHMHTRHLSRTFVPKLVPSSNFWLSILGSFVVRGFFAPKLERNAIATLPWNAACWFAKLGGFQAQVVTVVTYSDLYFTWLDFCWRTMPPRFRDV